MCSIYGSQTGTGCVLELLQLSELETKSNTNSAFRIALCTSSMCRFNVMAGTVDKVAIVAAVWFSLVAGPVESFLLVQTI